MPPILLLTLFQQSVALEQMMHRHFVSKYYAELKGRVASVLTNKVQCRDCSDFTLGCSDRPSATNMTNKGTSGIAIELHPTFPCLPFWGDKEWC